MTLNGDTHNTYKCGCVWLREVFSEVTSGIVKREQETKALRMRMLLSQWARNLNLEYLLTDVELFDGIGKKSIWQLIKSTHNFIRLYINREEGSKFSLIANE